MQNDAGLGGVFAQCLSGCICVSLLACGSSDAGAEGAVAGVLAQAPHCPAGTDALKMEGTIAGGAIDDSRTKNDINAGTENFTSGSFRTPLTELAPLAESQLALTFTWPRSLFYGETSAITAGNLTLPATHPQAGAKFCVSAGQVGYADGGSEDGAFKFAITELKAGADCSGAPTAADLRGCFQ